MVVNASNLDHGNNLCLASDFSFANMLCRTNTTELGHINNLCQMTTPSLMPLVTSSFHVKEQDAQTLEQDGLVKDT